MSLSFSPRTLFLDDDPVRAVLFQAEHPDAVWVQTVPECLARLAEPWDEVYLDHDLGGESFVDHEREDCGMAVVRWLCEAERPHLKTTHFIIHTLNPHAACIMVFYLQTMGFWVEQRPFGTRAAARGASAGLPSSQPTFLGRALGWLRGHRRPPPPAGRP